MSTTGEKLRLLRKEFGYSQDFVAKKLQIERTTYVKWESGASNPHKKIAELAKLYDVSADYLLSDTDEPPVHISQQKPDNISKEEQEKLETAKRAYNLLMQMPPEMQKAAIAQLQALADLNKK